MDHTVEISDIRRHLPALQAAEDQLDARTKPQPSVGQEISPVPSDRISKLFKLEDSVLAGTFYPPMENLVDPKTFRSMQCLLLQANVMSRIHNAVNMGVEVNQDFVDTIHYDLIAKLRPSLLVQIDEMGDESCQQYLQRVMDSYINHGLTNGDNKPIVRVAGVITLGDTQLHKSLPAILDT